MKNRAGQCARYEVDKKLQHSSSGSTGKFSHTPDLQHWSMVVVIRYREPARRRGKATIQYLLSRWKRAGLRCYISYASSDTLLRYSLRYWRSIINCGGDTAGCLGGLAYYIANASPSLVVPVHCGMGAAPSIGVETMATYLGRLDCCISTVSPFPFLSVSCGTADYSLLKRRQRQMI